MTSVETGRIDLLRALNQGLLPPHYLQDAARSEKSLEAYLQDYLKEEVFAEGLAVEVKGSSNVTGRDLSGLKAFMDEHSPKKAVVVCNEKEKRALGKIVALP